MITAIIILFLLQFLTLSALVILYLRLQKTEQLYEEQRELVEQFEMSMQLYLDEIKKENEQLLERLTERPRQQKKTENHSTPEMKPLVIPPIEDEFVATPQSYASHLQAKLIQEQRKKMSTFEELNEMSLPIPQREEQIESPIQEEMQTQVEEKEETYEEQVKRLYDEGESIEALAKRFDRGKTEIELLLKFHR